MTEGFSTCKHDVNINASHRAEATRPERHTSFLEPTLDAAKKHVSPEVMPGLEQALRIADKQAIDNFRVIHPKGAPGAAFSVTKLTITPDILRAIASKMPLLSKGPQPINAELKSEPLHRGEKIIYFVTPPFSNQQDATVHLDEGFNLFMRNLGKVAGAIKRVEEPPAIEFHFFGSSTGLGGKETARSLFNRLLLGPKEHAKYYAEYIRNHVTTDPEILKKTRIIVEGISRGVTTADEAYEYLPKQIQDQTQVKLELPIDKVAGFDLAASFIEEMIWQGKNNPFFPIQKKAGEGFNNYMTERHGLVKDSLRQKVAKLAGFAIDTGHLLRGTEMHTGPDDSRRYILQGTRDPMADQEALQKAVDRIGKEISSKPKENNDKKVSDETVRQTKEASNKEVEGKEGSKTVQFAQIREGKSSRYPFDGRHFYAASQRFGRWESILRYAKSAVDSIK